MTESKKPDESAKAARLQQLRAEVEMLLRVKNSNIICPDVLLKSIVRAVSKLTAVQFKAALKFEATADDVTTLGTAVAVMAYGTMAQALGIAELTGIEQETRAAAIAEDLSEEKLQEMLASLDTDDDKNTKH